ncbi:MAG: hypothetical protein K5846_08440 [Bacteroidales bacterium]|nr:hypothetical protein [Bacteroidales bacterium]
MPKRKNQHSRQGMEQRSNISEFFGDSAANREKETWRHTPNGMVHTGTSNMTLKPYNKGRGPTKTPFIDYYSPTTNHGSVVTHATDRKEKT